MESKYKILHKDDSVRYQAQSPVLIEVNALVLNEETGKKHGQIKFKSLTRKKIIQLKAKIKLLDVAGRELGEIEKYYLDLSVGFNAEFGGNNAFAIKEKNVREFVPIVTEVCFEDGSVWTSSSAEWSRIKPQEKLDEKFSTESIEQFKKEKCKKALYVYSEHEDLWRCSCGAINKDSEEKCTNCEANRNDVKTYDEESLRNAYIYAQAEELLAARTFISIQGAIEKYSQILEWGDSKEKKEQAEKLLPVVEKEEEIARTARKKKKKKVAIISSICSMLAAVVIIAVVIISNVATENKYLQAKDYYKQGKYFLAQNLFNELGDYKDSSVLKLKANNMAFGNYDEIIESENLTKFTIPNGVEEIKQGAFESDKLKEITIPASVKEFEFNAFYGCSNLKKVHYEGTIDQWVQIYFASALSNPLNNGADLYINNQKVTNVQLSTATSVKKFAFYGYDELENVSLSETTVNIEEEAFSGCTSLESVELSSSIKSIEELAFNGCSSLKEVKIPNSVTNIAKGAFKGCSSLEKITLPFIGESASASRGYDQVLGYIFGYETRTYNTTVSGATMQYTTGTSTYATRYHYYIPSSLKEIIVTGNTIRSRAFNNCSRITDVTISNSVTSIGNFAFEGCTALESIEIPNSVTSIGDSAFEGCTSLESIEIPNSVTSIWDSAFEGCTSLESIEIPSSVTYIGQYVFSGCADLTSVTFSENSTFSRINNQTFEGCESLESIEIPNSVTSIGDSAFEGCSSLKEVKIPNSVTSIEKGAFKGCSSLEKITLPFIGESASASSGYNQVLGYIFGYETRTYNTTVSGATMQYATGSTYSGTRYYYYIPTSLNSVEVNLEEIPKSAFYNCSQLTNIMLSSDVVKIGNAAFDGCANLENLYYLGTEEQWAQVSVEGNNEELTRANIFFVDGQEHTYNFVTNCEQEIESVSSVSAIRVPILENRENYTFVGWYDNEEFNGEPIGTMHYSTTNVTLYAKWVELSYDGTSIERAITITDYSFVVNISTGGQKIYYKFIPSTSRYYRISSTGNHDTKMTLYNSNGVVIATDDDSGTNNNFSLNYRLQQNNTYYLCVSLYRASSIGSFVVTIS